jgi:cytochrome c biogenesis protein CcdA
MEAYLSDLILHSGSLAIAAAFGVGVLTSLAPCSIVTLPLLVAAAVKGAGGLEAKARARFTLLFSFLFTAGLVLSFSLLAYAAARFGALLSVAPAWLYLVASLAVLLIALQGMGKLPDWDKTVLVERLIRFRLAGAALIGVIFGLVSTPCASAPLVAIVTVAGSSGAGYAYALVLAFALGHGTLLLAAGISVGFAQRIASSSAAAAFSRLFSLIFSAVLLAISGWFAWRFFEQAVL